MKNTPTYLALLAFSVFQPAAALFAADAAANLPRNQRIDMLVVAEQSKNGAELAKKSSDTKPTVFLVDGGYIEGGDPIAGEKPPSADTVKSNVLEALHNANFQQAPDAASASVILVYTWGTLRPQWQPTVSGSHIAPNLKARLSLVAPWKTVSDIEDDIVTRRVTNFSTGSFLMHPNWRDAIDFARDARYFVVFSAYESNITNGAEAAPLWRTTVSTQETSTSMHQGVASLAASAGEYLGKDMNSPKNTYAARVTLSPTSVSSTAPAQADVAEKASNANSSDVIKQLVKRERDRVSGEFGQKNEEKDVW
ncbi:MAG TPA: hypothetical protein VFT72_03480 [Opitutaceae bacterium]|nr:hypothetical protein [Opitutaceae bacterium]